MNGPGYLAVAIQPGWNTDEQIFHDWYSVEHGPLRVRLPFITTGDRYHAIDDQKPEWSAVYDVSDLSCLEKRIYTRLREERSMREKAVMGTFEYIDRKIYSLISSRGAYEGSAPVTVAVSMRIKESDLDQFNNWYEQEHTDMLAKIPGWIRTRRFRMVAGGLQGMPPEGQLEYLAVHDYKAQNGLDGPEHIAAQETSWRNEMMCKVLQKERRVWSHYAVFDQIQEPPSTVIATDSAELRFQLEGSPHDPVVVFINSILTTFHIWDDVAKALIAGVDGKSFRVLRYNPRGYSDPKDRSNHSSFDLLANDLEYLLSRLGLDRVHAVVGVSMGGVTAINFALLHPKMLAKFVACDCNVASTPTNNESWAERIELSQSKGMVELADVTVQRWFTPENRRTANAKKVHSMIADASVDGFEQNALALCKFDLQPRLPSMEVPGLLLVGEEDSKLPQAMAKFDIPNSSFKTIPKAGHLPMLENHQCFVKLLAEFL